MYMELYCEFCPNFIDFLIKTSFNLLFIPLSYKVTNRGEDVVSLKFMAKEMGVGCCYAFPEKDDQDDNIPITDCFPLYSAPVSLDLYRKRFYSTYFDLNILLIFCTHSQPLS